LQEHRITIFKRALGCEGCAAAACALGADALSAAGAPHQNIQALFRVSLKTKVILKINKKCIFIISAKRLFERSLSALF
jgi:hypothetical protein